MSAQVDNLVSREQYFIIPINPEPWEVPPFYAGRAKGGRLYAKPGQDARAAQFKDSVREFLTEQGAYMMKPPYEIEFYFDHKRVKSASKIVDVTNMQKLAEDTLQGIVIDNDRNVVKVTSCAFPQDEDAAGMFGVIVRDNVPIPGIPYAWGMEWAEMRQELMSEDTKSIEIIKENNKW